MNPLVVVVRLCLLAHPEHCIERELSLGEDLPATPYVCAQAQLEIAKLLATLPGYGVKGWTCGHGRGV